MVKYLVINSESNFPEDIKNGFVASNIDLLSVMESWRYSVKKAVLKNFANSKENTCARVSCWSLKKLDPEKAGAWKTWTPKNLHREKHESWTYEINMGLKVVSDFKELHFIKIMRKSCSKVCLLTGI